MTDGTKPTLAECIEWCDVRSVADPLVSTTVGRAREEEKSRFCSAILSHLRTLSGVEAGTHVVVPVGGMREGASVGWLLTHGGWHVSVPFDYEADAAAFAAEMDARAKPA